MNEAILTSEVTPVFRRRPCTLFVTATCVTVVKSRTHTARTAEVTMTTQHSGRFLERRVVS